ncbi:class I SAM-dependent methyltransferase [Clostridium sp. UBA6640]|uniref:class I SAM-dependent methyltransferase n=1 Tax=Clostridium sp. UBA6640 TaxID=1946370 RepID=UPI0025C63BE1|nr:class I SAM-dependent methyltransferase [Clostridium sp. UBA6640]
MSYYGSLCTQIYDLDKPTIDKEQLDFYMGYITDKKMRILEPMCGSGRFIIPFLEEGFNIEGFDISDDMLNSCRERMKTKNLNGNVFNAGIHNFQTEAKYDLIMIPVGSFSLLLDKEIVISSLNRLKENLNENGTLLLDVLTTECRAEECDKWEEANRMTRADGKVIVQYSKSHYDKTNKIISSPLRYELLDGDKIIESEEMDFSMRLYDINEFEEILKNIGFKHIKIIRDCNMALYPNEENIIFECRI